ncbi:MAG: ArsR family transcriptional regulator [Patescibacteria group bacterium]
MDASKRLNNIDIRMADDQAVRLCARRHGTIGDLTAMRICYLFRNYPELSVTDIAKLVSVSVSAASRQLKKLKEVEILQSSKHAQTVYYSMPKNNFTDNLIGELGRDS